METKPTHPAKRPSSAFLAARSLLAACTLPPVRGGCPGGHRTAPVPSLHQPGFRLHAAGALSPPRRTARAAATPPRPLLPAPSARPLRPRPRLSRPGPVPGRRLRPDQAARRHGRRPGRDRSSRRLGQRPPPPRQRSARPRPPGPPRPGHPPPLLPHAARHLPRRQQLQRPAPGTAATGDLFPCR